MATASKRDQLIDAALRLFYREGFNATGIDKILAEAGVAKMTLYKHFGSKEELIREVLRKRDQDFGEWIMQYVESHAATPRDRLLALFDAHFEWFSQRVFSGCMFLNAAAEFSRINEPVSSIADESKKRLRGYVRGLASAAEAGSPDHLADSLMLLLEGAIGCAQVSGDRRWAQKARDAAEILIDAEIEPRSTRPGPAPSRSAASSG
jgi:AcrR family transcriptional regulator